MQDERLQNKQLRISGACLPRRTAATASLASKIFPGACPFRSMPPNIVLILADDLGWGDMSFGGAPNTSPVPTPHLDALAENGLTFEQLYTNPTCAPSRGALMTGHHTGHATVRSNAPTYTPLRSDEVTVAQLLRRANYSTGLVGKVSSGAALLIAL